MILAIYLGLLMHAATLGATPPYALGWATLVGWELLAPHIPHLTKA